jgi:hypothetical protein
MRDAWAVIDERELVGLLYRADWTRLSLSGRVRGGGQFPPTSPGEGWPGSFGGQGLHLGSFSVPDSPPVPSEWMMATAERSEAESALMVAPGKRYRLATEDGSRVLGCDGERVWQWLADVPPGERVTFERKPQPPIPGLLAPAWLLLGYRLSVEGETTVAGRAGIVVTGTARTPRLPGLSEPMALPWDLTPRPERVSAVVDVELGILLRRELGYPGGTVGVTEFLELEVGGAVDPSGFGPVAGSFFGDGAAGERRLVDDVGVEALKMVAGLAAGGLGAAIKYAPKRHVDPFAAATAEDPDDVMPDDEPLPAWAGGDAAGAAGAAAAEDAGAAGAASEAAGASEENGRAPVGDEVLNLLYRGGLEPTPFSARLCEWTDSEVVGGAMLGAVPESARRAGFGGVGFLVDAMKTMEHSPGRISHEVYSVRVGGWERFRVDRVFRTPPARARGIQVTTRHHDAATVACDGQRTFRVFEDEVRAGPGQTLDRGWRGPLAQLVDGSWLLGCRLSGGEVVEVDGRTGYRVIATTGTGPVTGGWFSWVPGWWLPAVAVVDASSGRLLRLTRYRDGEAATRAELRSVSDGGSDDFGFTPPDGLPVVEEQEPDRSGGSDDDDLKFFGPDGRPSSPPEEVRAVVDAFKKQVDEKVAAAVGFLGSFLGGPRLVGQEVLEGGGGLERDLFGQEVAAGQRAAGYRVGVLAPDLGHVAVVAADEAVLAPEGEQRDGDALAARRGGVVVFEVGAGGGAVVLARGVDRGRVAEAADVLVDRLLVERLAAAPPAAHPAAHPTDWVGAELVLGERLGLGEEEPVPVGEAELHVRRAEGVAGGHDVQHRELGDQVGVVKRQSVAHPGAAVVANHGELVEAELAHDQRLVPRHRALGVGLMGRAARRLAAVAIAAQVGEDDRMILGEDRGDVVPHDVGLRVAVQQQDGRAALVASHQCVDSDPSWGERDSLEQVGQGNGHGSVIPVMEVT